MGAGDSERLWGVQNGRDQLHENWPALFEPEDDLVLPSEEMSPASTAARDYGWPYCFQRARGRKGNKVLAPQYGGDGESGGPLRGRCGGRREVFPAHWAPLSLLFYTGGQFPSRYRRGAFVAFHGSRFDPENARRTAPATTWSSCRSRTAGPPAASRCSPTARGTGHAPAQDAALHRPVGLAQGPDGSLYISDDKGRPDLAGVVQAPLDCQPAP